VGIGCHILDKPVAEFLDGKLIAFSERDYDYWQRTYGIRRLLPDENFYIATNKQFLGYQATDAMVSVWRGRIYKICFSFTHSSVQGLEKFRSDLLAYMSDRYGEPSEVRRLTSDVTVSIWDGDFGNFIVHSGDLVTTLILTSSSLRSASSKDRASVSENTSWSWRPSPLRGAMGLSGKLFPRHDTSGEAKPQGTYKAAVFGARIRSRLFQIIDEVQAEIGMQPIALSSDGTTLLTRPELDKRLKKESDCNMLELALLTAIQTLGLVRWFNEQWPSAVEKYRGRQNTPDLLREKARSLASYILNNLVAGQVYKGIYPGESELSLGEDYSTQLEEAACWCRIVDELAQRGLGPGTQTHLLAAYIQDQLAYLLALRGVASPDTICNTMAARTDEYGRYQKWLREGGEPPYAGTLLWEAAKHIGYPLGCDKDAIFHAAFVEAFVDRVTRAPIFELLTGQDASDGKPHR
jgi:hypothetical protein